MKDEEKKVIDATNGGAGEPIETPEETVSLKKFKSVWNERQGFKDTVAVKEAELGTLTEKFNNLNSKLDEYKGYKTKLDDWNADRLGEKVTKWTEESKIFDAKEGDTNFERVNKIKDKFAFGSDETPLTSEQLDKNFELMGIYTEANYFDVEPANTEPLNSSKPTAEPTVGKGKYFGYSTPAELSSADWKLAEKWKRENGGHW